MAALPTALDFDAGISDAGLVLAARAGDRSALAQLIGRHRPLVLTMCRRVLGSSQLAEDAVQEACLQAMLGLDALRDPHRFGPWLVGIGLNVCRHLLRQPTVDSLSALELSGGWSASGIAAFDPGRKTWPSPPTSPPGYEARCCGSRPASAAR